MTLQQAPFFLGQNDELVGISSALTDWCAHFEVCEYLKNYYNQNTKLLAHAYGAPKANNSTVSICFSEHEIKE